MIGFIAAHVGATPHNARLAIERKGCVGHPLALIASVDARRFSAQPIVAPRNIAKHRVASLAVRAEHVVGNIEEAVVDAASIIQLHSGTVVHRRIISYDAVDHRELALRILLRVDRAAL